MNDAEVPILCARLEKFKILKARRQEIINALRALTEDWKEGPCGQNPYTGNTRESRDVTSIYFKFSTTKGGAPPTDHTLSDLQIPAFDVRTMLEGILRKQLGTINTDIEDL